MKAFVTGASGFIGRRLTRQLVERGEAVRALVRDPARAAELQAMGVELVKGDILQPESMRAGMEGCDVAFHLAGYYKLGARDARAQGERINVEGTRIALSLAHELGVPRSIYTSSLAVNGDTHGEVVDENYHLPQAPTTTHYDATKWAAHEAALELIHRGAPVIICMPGVVFGPGDQSVPGELLRAFLAGQMPLLPAADSGLTYVHVEDLAAGLIAAAERGTPGESYITAGPPFRLGELVDLWARVAGLPAPRIRIPGGLLRPFWPLMALLGRLVPLPQSLSGEGTRMAGLTYFGSAEKAKRELGWVARDVEARLGETIAAERAAMGI